MKKRILLILFVGIATINIFAQPVISSAFFGNAGDSYATKGIEPATMDPGLGGADVTWDFSDAVFTGGSETRSIVDASATPYASDFTDASVALVIDDTSFSYYHVSPSMLVLHGSATPTITQVFDDPADLIAFPVTYNDLKEDDFSGSGIVLGFSVSLNGTTSAIADGYGTIILPGGATYFDVLRLKVEIPIEAVVDGLPVTAEINSTIYYWVKEGVLGPVMQYSTAATIISGLPSGSSTLADVNESLLVPIFEFENDKEEILLYPNPAQEAIHFANSIEQSTVQIFDLLGNQVLQTKLNCNSLDVSSIQSGNYIIQISNEEKISQSYFTVSK